MEKKLIISKGFRRSIIKVMIAITLFFFFYLLLFALSLAVLAGSVWLGKFMITAKSSVFIILAGLSIIFTGLMLFIFTIKFIFSRHRDEYPYRVQIIAKDHPELFKIIFEVADQVGIRRPRKVFLVHDINASVFYNSSILSLIFPVKKNLDIGLGLIKTLNTGELKAVLAHEFGHFSQKSMRLGSYVYTVNHVIYNLAYKYDAWDRTIESWASQPNLGSFFAVFALWTAEIMRMGLKKAYHLVNIQYMGLSREMELHADQISALIAGKENSISALRRIEFCNDAFIQTLKSINKLAKDKIMTEDIYLNYSFELGIFNKFFRLETEEGLPVLTGGDFESIIRRPRVICEDPWDSHPSRAAREKNIRSLNLENPEPDKSGSWMLLEDLDLWQKKLTEQIYKVHIGSTEGFEMMDHEHYVKYRETERLKFKIDDIYQNFYQSRILHPFDLGKVISAPLQNDVEEEFNSIYSIESKLKFHRTHSEQLDMILLRQIQSKEVNASYIKFDEVRYHAREIKEIIARLEKDLEAHLNECISLEERALLFNLALSEKISPAAKDEFKAHWSALSGLFNMYFTHEEFYNQMLDFNYKIYNQQKDSYEMKLFIREMADFEKHYKSFVKEHNLEAFEHISKKHAEELRLFVMDSIFYIKVSQLDIGSFNQFMELVRENQDLIIDGYFIKLKELTDYQKKMYRELKLPFAE